MDARERSRLAAWSCVGLAVAALSFLAGWYQFYNPTRFGGDGSTFLLVGVGVYVASFFALVVVLTPLVDVQALREERLELMFWVAVAILAAFNAWASFQLYTFKEHGI